MDISKLVAAVSDTPIKLYAKELLAESKVVPADVANAVKTDAHINTFALAALVTIQQSEETLIDPTNNADAKTQSTVQTLSDISAAYTAVHAITKAVPVVIPPVNITV